MTYNSSQTLALLLADQTLEVRTSTGELAFIASTPRIIELCQAGQVAGRARGRNIRYLELLVPLDEVAPAYHASRSSCYGCAGEDSRTVRRGEDLLANVYSHDPRRCGAYGQSREAYFALGSDSI